MLVDCVRGVEEHASEAEPAGEATPTIPRRLESGSGTGYSMRGDNGQPEPAAHRQARLARTSYAVFVRHEYAAPSRTRWHTHTHEAEHAGPIPIPLKKPKITPPPSAAPAFEGTQIDKRVDA